MKKVFVALLVFCSAVSASSQQIAEQKKDTVNKLMDEVVITAQRQPQQQLYIPYSVNTISRNQIDELGTATTPDVLMKMNGVFIQKTNLGGGSAFIRGVTGNQVLMLTDGIRINNATYRYGPNQYLNTIDPFTIANAEVAKGTGSVQYGTDAIGGVINIITKEPQLAINKSFVTANVAGRYVSGDMEKTIRGEAAWATKKIAMQAGISTKRFGNLIGGDTTGVQTPSGYNEFSFDTKTRFLLADRMELKLASQFVRQNNVPVYHKIQLEGFEINEMEQQQRLLTYARLTTQGKSSLLSKAEFTASFQHTNEGRNSKKKLSDILRTENDQVATVGFSAAVVSMLHSKWTANSGAEIYMDRISSRRTDVNVTSLSAVPKRALYADGSTYNNYSLYSLHHFRSGKWLVDAGLRYNVIRIGINDTAYGNVTANPSAWVGNVAFMYTVANRQTIYLSFSNGFRAPNIDDMGSLGIVDFRYEIPAPALKPERSKHVELGYKLQSSKVRVTLSAYYMHLSQLITRVKIPGESISGYQVYKKENTEAAFIKGAEADFQYKPSPHFEINGGLAYCYGNNLSRQEPLRRIPPFNGGMMTTYKKNKLFLGAEWQFASQQTRLALGDKEDNRIPAGGTPGWQLLNFYSGYKLGCIQINTGLQNIFNTDYRIHGSGINGAGRNMWLSISIKL